MRPFLSAMGSTAWVLERCRSNYAGVKHTSVLPADGEQVLARFDFVRHAQNENKLVLVKMLVVRFVLTRLPVRGFLLFRPCVVFRLGLAGVA